MSRRILLAVPASLLALTVPAPAAEPAHDPEARRLLDEVVAAYKALPSYSDRGEFSLAVTIHGAPQRRVIPFHLALARPNRIDLDAGPVRLVCDGTSLRAVVVPLKSYTEAPAPAAITPETFVDSPMGAFLFGGPLGLPLPVLLNLLVADDAARSILDLTAGRLEAEPDRKHHDQAVKALVIVRDDGPDLRLLVDPETKLLVRIELIFVPEAPDVGLPEAAAVSGLDVAWSAGTVSTEAPEAGAFAFEPPKGFARVESLAVDRPAAKPKEPEPE